jgi:hypothetical protein
MWCGTRTMVSRRSFSTHRVILRPSGRRRSTWVLASNILEHFEPGVAASVVDDVGRMLKPGGRFIIIQPNFRYAAKHYFDDYTHRSVFTDVSLPNLLRAHGFAIDRVDPRFLPYSMRGDEAADPSVDGSRVSPVAVQTDGGAGCW